MWNSQAEQILDGFQFLPFLSAISTAKNLGKENGQVHQPILEGQVLPHKSASKLTPLSLSSVPWVLCPLLLNTKSLLYSCAFFLRKCQSLGFGEEAYKMLTSSPMSLLWAVCGFPNLWFLPDVQTTTTFNSKCQKLNMVPPILMFPIC